MPHRRLVQIGARPPAPATDSLPTVAQYFKELADRQGEDIRLLKERAQVLAGLHASRKAKTHHRSIREESWRLHPVVVPAATAPKKPKKANQRSAAKGASRKKASKRNR